MNGLQKGFMDSFAQIEDIFSPESLNNATEFLGGVLGYAVIFIGALIIIGVVYGIYEWVIGLIDRFQDGWNRDTVDRGDVNEDIGV